MIVSYRSDLMFMLVLIYFPNLFSIYSLSFNLPVLQNVLFILFKIFFILPTLSFSQYHSLLSFPDVHASVNIFSLFIFSLLFIIYSSCTRKCFIYLSFLKCSLFSLPFHFLNITLFSLSARSILPISSVWTEVGIHFFSKHLCFITPSSLAHRQGKLLCYTSYASSIYSHRWVFVVQSCCGKMM